MNKNIFKLRIFFWLCLWWIVAWFFYMKIVSSGHIIYDFDFFRKSSFISKLTPDTRVEFGNRKFANIIVSDPVYFNLTIPRRFEKAVLHLKYKNMKKLTPSDKQIVEAGILVDKNIWRYDLKPVENNIIDSISLVWDEFRQDDLVLLSRPQVFKYNSVNDFLENFQDTKKLALYNYDFKKNYLINDYEPFSKEDVFSQEDNFTQINQSLRSNYQFFTYIKNEELNFEFEFIDLNKNLDKDTVVINLYYDDYLIATNHLDDDGIVDNEGKMSDKRKLKMQVSNLPEGSYKIELRCNDDIVTNYIKTKQKKIAFINNLWIEKTVNEQAEIVVFTNSKRVQFKTVHPSSLQKIYLEDNLFELNETYKQFDQEIIRNASSSAYSKIKLEKSGVILSGNGVFGFSEESLFEPRIKKIDRNLNIAEDEIDYVLASYVASQKNNDWQVASLEFDLTKAYSEDNKYSFLISALGLAESGNKIEVDGISVELFGASLEDKIKKLIKKNE